MKGQLKILLLGDKDTGKSSIISTYVSRYFPDEVPSLMTDAIIPPGSTGNMSNVAITIMDSSSLLGDREVLKQKICMADTIISLYDVTRPETIDSLESLWLPLIRDVYTNGSGQEQARAAAVLVVGNKKDRIGEHEESRLQVEEERMKNILRGFPFVVACYRCSAKLIDVDQIFYECELAVEFPLTPIFDTNKSEFTGVCKVAFSRIFRSFDADQDGRLSDEELCALQVLRTL
jgi:Ras family protein T1